MKKVGSIILNKTPIGQLIYPVNGIVYGSNGNMGGSGFISWTCCAFQTKNEAQKFVNKINLWHIENYKYDKSEMATCPVDSEVNEALIQYERIERIDYEVGNPIEVRELNKMEWE